ncbi:MAG: transcription-repair coupling factor [Ruminococcus sp.]|jgi:transcription-repair coupling factor (superfamily II helicase)|nr:transcription-repair coupling factor [Ruminococcus sp.]
MSLILEPLKKLPAFNEIKQLVAKKGGPLYASGFAHIHKAHFIAGLACNAAPAIPVILIVSDTEQAARRLSDDINTLTGETVSAVLPAKDFAFINSEAVSREYEYAAIGTLSNLINAKERLGNTADGHISVISASAEAVMQHTIPKDVLQKNTITIKNGDILDVDELIARLVAAGYTRAERVEGVSQFARRGSVFDVFPASEKNPVRFEFWGDEVDTAAYFDIDTQRRSGDIGVITIPPARSVLFESTEIQIARMEAASKSVRSKKADLIREHLSRDIQTLRDFGGGHILGNIDKYYPLAYERAATILDYLPENSLVIFSEYQNCLSAAKGVYSHHRDETAALYESGELFRMGANSDKHSDSYMLDFETFDSRANDFTAIYMDAFIRGGGRQFAAGVSLNAGQTAAWGGEIRQLIDDLKSFTERGYSVFVSAGSDKTLPIIQKDLADEGLTAEIITPTSVFNEGKTYLFPSAKGLISGGFDYTDAKVAFIAQSIHEHSKRKLKKVNKNEEIKSLSDIRKGDLIVHALHGIGRFEGIRKLSLEGVTKDYITIQYAGTDVLYVPVNQLDIVSKYIGPGGKGNDNETVKLNKLSSDGWQKQKAKVRAAVRDMADELIALYAKRSQTPGYAFPIDDDLINDFETRFPFTETDDQLTSTAEIKADMEKPLPMDRLLCGDVGFGKTEVAFRAAFKCIEDGKQCVLLAPTTVLAWQHYQTALKRFESFPVRIQLLSRFRTIKEQNRIKKELADGQIDFIIGTHMLIQKGVKFPDLGLVIIDEEQRFGVKHKEQFKQYFTGVDVLTLSATPIPRTLNMAMSGIRDMSVLEEAPIDRHPVQTYVLEYDLGVIIQAINKELRRGGQVYYIHNRIDSITLAAARIAENIPEARIGIAHGRMDEEELSEVWQKLVEHEIDVLVCTTLIETGVDVPNCNTLIIEDADRFGLSQLYQLRGRVGRSSRRAFAYFTFRRGKSLTEIAAKRLDAIREFTQFGSGFRIAMRDLEIRGAGSLLGARQHGHMESVGYDMYLQILSEVMSEERGEPLPQKPEDCLIDLQIEAHIPETYIPSLADRLDIYRKIASLKTNDQSLDLIDELIDRYGDPPDSINGLITVSLVRNKASAAGITEVTQKGDIMFFYIKTAEPETISTLVQTFKRRVTINSGLKPHIAVKVGKDNPLSLMTSVIEILSA